MNPPEAPHCGSVLLSIAGEKLTLLPQRAVCWSAQRTLFITDPHFGKAQAFRSAGIAAPERSHHDDLETLSDLIDRTDAARLIVLGDLLHARSGVREGVLGSLGAWRKGHADLDVLLVRGNHDRSAGDPPDDLRIRCVDPGERLGPFQLMHEPVSGPPEAGVYALAGHIHPGMRIGSGRAGQGARFPAFLFGPSQAVLPAFGLFTGLAMVRPRPGDRAAVIADGEVIDLGVC